MTFTRLVSDMRFTTLAFATFLLALAPHAVRAQAADTGEVRRWREDLAFLRREMPARHANLFHSMSPATFDSALSSIETRLPRFTRSQVIVELQKLAARVRDGHTNVSPWRDTVARFQTLPVVLTRFEGGYVVRMATREHASLLGARVVRIGSRPVAAAESLAALAVSRDSPMGVWQVAPMLLGMPEVLHALGMARDTRGVTLELEQNGRRRTVVLRPAGPFPNLSGDVDQAWNAREGWVDLRDGAPTPLWLTRTTENYWYTAVPGSRLLYCQVNQIQEGTEKLDAFFARAIAAADSVGAQRFVLDLRLNGGGNGYFNRKIVRALVRSRFDAPGALFVITSRRTFSAAQMLISDLEKWTHPIFVGEPSSSRGNHYGDSRRLVLPNHRITVRVSTLYWQYWDPRDTRPWIAPEIAAPLTAAAYRAGRDPALEAIAAYRAGSSLAEHLRPLAIAADSVAAERAVKDYFADRTHVWIDPQRELELQSLRLRAEGQPAASGIVDRIRRRLPAWSPPR